MRSLLSFLTHFLSLITLLYLFVSTDNPGCRLASQVHGPAHLSAFLSPPSVFSPLPQSLRRLLSSYLLNALPLLLLSLASFFVLLLYFQSACLSCSMAKGVVVLFHSYSHRQPRNIAKQLVRQDRNTTANAADVSSSGADVPF